MLLILSVVILFVWYVTFIFHLTIISKCVCLFKIYKLAHSISKYRWGQKLAEVLTEACSTHINKKIKPTFWFERVCHCGNDFFLFSFFLLHIESSNTEVVYSDFVAFVDFSHKVNMCWEYALRLFPLAFLPFNNQITQFGSMTASSRWFCSFGFLFVLNSNIKNASY